tara:strand:+ start:89615 stop:90364 length:750 start_codon:yes stop_codon:yes gene_type:complete
MSNTKIPVIAIIDDDPFMVKILLQLLGENEFKAIEIDESEDINLAIEKHSVDLVLLDLNLKNHYGFEIARDLRNLKNLGLIMLTGSDDQIDRLVGLEIGVDDYIAKPFDNRELKARCRNVLRRIAVAQDNSLNSATTDETTTASNNGSGKSTLNGLILDKNHFTLSTEDNNSIKLTNYEFKLFELFITAKDEAISRETISLDIYEREWSPFTRSVDVLVSKLRKKLTAFDCGLTLITVRGEGYKLVDSN